MKKLNRKNIILILIVTPCLVAFAYVTVNTRIEVNESIWDTSKKTYELNKDEALYTTTYLRKEGIVPVRIKSIEHIDSVTRAVIGTEAYLLYHDRTKNGEVPAGVGILEQRHFDLWGENMVPVSEVKWLNEDFCVIELKEENKEIAPDCEITYLVWGVFKKTVVGNSKED